MQTLDAILDDLKLHYAPQTPDYASLATDLVAHKAAALAAGDQLLAKHIWCLEHTVETHKLFLSAFYQLKGGNFYRAWCTLEQVELSLGRLRNHFALYWEACKLAYIDSTTVNLQGLFPYRVFCSPEILADKKTCSVCGRDISIRNPCGHKVGEIYDGEICSRIVEKWRGVGYSLVTHPVQKYSVAFLTDPNTGQPRDHYNYSTVRYLAERWPHPFAGWTSEWTTRPHPKEKFSLPARNGRCPCKSGKKYKNCCMRREGIMCPHVVISFDYNIPEHLRHTEYSY
jgi:hypothetical protein